MLRQFSIHSAVCFLSTVAFLAGVIPSLAAQAEVSVAVRDIGVGDWVQISGTCTTPEGNSRRCRATRGFVTRITSDTIDIRGPSDGTTEKIRLSFLTRLNVYKGDPTFGPPPRLRTRTEVVMSQLLWSSVASMGLSFLGGTVGYQTDRAHGWTGGDDPGLLGLVWGVGSGIVIGATAGSYLVGHRMLPARGAFPVTLLGAATGLALWTQVHGDPDSGPWFVVSLIGLPVIGSVVGYHLTAKMDPLSVWEDIPLDRLQVKTGPNSDGGFSFGLGLQF